MLVLVSGRVAFFVKCFPLSICDLSEAQSPLLLTAEAHTILLYRQRSEMISGK